MKWRVTTTHNCKKFQTVSFCLLNCCSIAFCWSFLKEKFRYSLFGFQKLIQNHPSINQLFEFFEIEIEIEIIVMRFVLKVF
jgi:hypothetical protein